MGIETRGTRLDAGLLVLRVGLAILLLFHGVYKLRHGVDFISGSLTSLGLPAALRYGAYVGEIIAPVLLILGLWTRLAAVAVAFHFVMAIVLMLRGSLFTLKPMGGGWSIELEALFIVAAIALALTGGGRYAVMHTRMQ